MFVFANGRNQIWKLFIENVLGVFRSAATSRTVQRVDRLIPVCRDHASRFRYSLRGQRMLRSLAHIDLACIAGANIVAFVLGLSHVAGDIGASSDRLGFEGFEFAKRYRI